MPADWTVVVVYCDGTSTAKHAPTPVAAYRRTAGGWVPLHSGIFRGENFILAPSGIDHLIADTRLSEAEVLQRLGEPRRSRYRWPCPQSGCFDLMANDFRALGRMFDLHAATGEISLSQIDHLQKANAKLHRGRRNNR